MRRMPKEVTGKEAEYLPAHHEHHHLVGMATGGVGVRVQHPERRVGVAVQVGYVLEVLGILPHDVDRIATRIA
jgi:hypothetical protein